MYEISYLNVEKGQEDLEAIVKKVLDKCFEEEGLLDSKLIMTITFTTPEEIRKINKKYRKIDKATDVLSFPMFEKEEIMKVCKEEFEGLKETLGDVIIDAPAGLDDGLAIALGGADEVIMVITPEYSSMRDCEVVTMALKEYGIGFVHYILNKVNTRLMKAGLAPSLKEFPRTITDKIIGLVQEDENIHISTNMGVPIVFMEDTYIAKNFDNIAKRIETLQQE